MNDPTLSRQAGAGDLKITVQLTPDTQPLSAAYRLSPEQAAFFKAETRIDDDDKLKTRKRAHTSLGISTLPEYKTIIKLGQERPDGILLDIGSCFGVDARKAVADGFPLENVVTTDLRKEFSDLGHALFNTTPETYPISFVAGDAFDPAILSIVPPFQEPPSTERPNLSTVASLNPLAGHCSVVYASNFFHLFSEDNQCHLASALAGLLSPEPGSMICGEQAGNSEKGVIRAQVSGRMFDMFLHGPDSWRALWNGVFPDGKARVHAKLERAVRGAGLAYNRLQWSVVRL